jgi:pyruvate dehydrogenase E1 component alpha subunit
MYLAAADLGILGENPVVGSNVPMAAGAALALKMRGQTGVVACFFGDGATNTGAWHEALNMAALWDLPVVFLCENNLYAISVPLKAAMANAAIEERAIGYGIAGYRVDGMNVLEVHDFAKAAIDEARDAGRPSFLVFDTYRFTGHHASDSEQYRPKDEVLREFRERDPIHFIEREMGEKCEIDPVTMADMRTEIRDEIEAAFARASDAPWPDPETLFEGLYAEGGGPHE